MPNDEDYEPIITSSATRVGVTSLLWAIAVIAFAMGLTALIIAGFNKTTLDNDDLDHIAKLVRGLSNNPVIDGSNPDKNDINVRHNLYVGRDAIVNGTLYARDGIVSAGGSASFNGSITTNYGNFTAEHGSFIGRCFNSLWTFNVSSASPVAIAVNDVVSLVNGRVRLGFGELNDIAVANSVGSQTQNVATFSLSATRTVNLLLSASNDLLFQLVDLDPQTLESTVYTAYSLGLAGTFTNDFTFKGVGVDGDATRFMVMYTQPTTGTEIDVAGVRITATSGTTVTFDTDIDNLVSTAAQTNPCLQDFTHLYDNVYGALFTQNSGLNLRTITVVTSGATWTFTLGTLSVVHATGFTAGEICFVGSMSLMYTTGTTAYVAISFGGGDTTTDIRTNAMVVVGTTWTAIDTTQTRTVQAAPGTGSRHQALALAADGTQYAVAFQAGSLFKFGEVHSYTLTRSTMGVVAVSATEAFIFNNYDGYFISLFSGPPFEMVSLGGTNTNQQIGICWQTTLPTSFATYCERFTLNAGVYSNASNYVAISNYNSGFLALGRINDTAFTALFTIRDVLSATAVRFAVVSYDADGQLHVSRTKGEFPIGWAVSAADAGDSVTVQLSGCVAGVAPAGTVSNEVFCLHGDGTFQSGQFVLDGGSGQDYLPVCNCVYLSEGIIDCDRAFTRASRSVYYNAV